MSRDIDASGRLEYISSKEVLRADLITEDHIKRYREKLGKYLRDEKPFRHEFAARTYLRDMVYLMGTAIDEDRYSGAQGYDEFKRLLSAALTTESK